MVFAGVKLHVHIPKKPLNHSLLARKAVEQKNNFLPKWSNWATVGKYFTNQKNNKS